MYHRGDRGPAGNQTLHGLFAARVHDNPDQIVLKHEGRQQTYRELSADANRLARHLRDVSGIRHDDRVAILARDPVLVVRAMLAVLQAGGAYLPLDPDHPPAVLQQILDDADPACVLFESRCAASLTFHAGDLYPLDVQLPDAPDQALEPVGSPSDLAYVIYTSGTTGAPKGVAVEHCAIVNTITWRNAYYRFEPADIVLQLSRPSFDSSVADIFCTLTSGGRLILPIRERTADPRYLTSLIASQSVSRLLATPALYRRLLAHLDKVVGASLRTVTVAGEWFTMALVEEHYRRLPHVELHNEYGPSENAVCSTAHFVQPSDRSVFIGRPVTGVQALVLDENNVPVEPGEVGELHLAGAGLARGYLGLEPQSSGFYMGSTPPLQNTRAYRTGDLVRLHGDGNLQFIERRDRQVKIRGQRVELEHVTRCLLRNDHVDDVFVIHRLVPPDTHQLIAFVVGPTEQDGASLQAFAREHLPAHMVPTVFVTVRQIALTANGKIDEDALMACYAPTTRVTAEPDSGSAVERALLRLCTELPLPAGLDDDLVASGLDSLVMMDLLAAVEQEFGLQLDTTQIYQNTTIRDLARMIERLLGHGARG